MRTGTPVFFLYTHDRFFGCCVCAVLVGCILMNGLDYYISSFSMVEIFISVVPRAACCHSSERSSTDIPQRINACCSFGCFLCVYNMICKLITDNHYITNSIDCSIFDHGKWAVFMFRQVQVFCMSSLGNKMCVHEPKRLEKCREINRR